MRGASRAFLLLFLFLLYSRVQDLALTWLHIPLIASVLALIGLILSGGLRGMLDSPIARALFGFSLWLIIAIPFSVWKGGSFDIVANTWLKSLSVFVLIAGCVAASRHVVTLFYTIAFALLVAAGLALQSNHRLEGRLVWQAGSYGNPNDLAFAMIVCGLLWLFIIRNPRAPLILRGGGWGVIGICMYVILETGSRAGFLTVAVVSAIIFWRLSVQGKVRMAVVGGVLVAIAAATSSDVYLRRIRTLTEQEPARVTASEDGVEAQAVGSTNQRMMLLADSIALTMKNPLFGVGPGTFSVGQQQAANERGVRAAWRGTHNTYTQVSSEAGIPALLLFLAVIYYSIRDLRRTSRVNAATPHSSRAETAAALQTLELLWWAHVVVFPFYHLAYSTVIPTLAGLSAAMTQTRGRELRVLREQRARAEKAAPPHDSRHGSIPSDDVSHAKPAEQLSTR